MQLTKVVTVSVQRSRQKNAAIKMRVWTGVLFIHHQAELTATTHFLIKGPGIKNKLH